MKNLQALNIDSMALVGSIHIEGDGYAQLSDVLGRHQNNWPRRSVDKLGLYEIQGVRHHLGLNIEVNRRESSNIARFNLEAHPFSNAERLRDLTRQRQEHQFAEIQAILADLAQSGLTSRIHSHIAWRFPPDSKRSIISLPLMTIQNPTAPFSEVSGVRLRKATSGGFISVILDLLGDRSLVVTVMFPLPSVKISDTLVDTTTQQGCQIIRDFVLDQDNPV